MPTKIDTANRHELLLKSSSTKCLLGELYHDASALEPGLLNSVIEMLEKILAHESKVEL